MRNALTYLMASGVLMLACSCGARQGAEVPLVLQSSTPLPQSRQPDVDWGSDPTDCGMFGSEAMRRAWADFERSQPYRLARRSDRVLSPEALARVNSHSPPQVAPCLTWWGARGLVKSEGTDVLVAVVADPSRTDRNRYGLVVLAAPKSEGRAYKAYWAAREEDMESYLLSASSGSIFVECIRGDGSREVKRLVWDGKARRFELAAAKDG